MLLLSSRFGRAAMVMTLGAWRVVFACLGIVVQEPAAHSASYDRTSLAAMAQLQQPLGQREAIADRRDPKSLSASECSDPTHLPNGAVVVQPDRPGTTLAEPGGLQTLSQALAGAAGGSDRTIYLRGGAYDLADTLVLDAKFSRLRIAACPGEIPVLRSSGSLPAILLRDVDSVSLSGLVFDGPATAQLLLERAQHCRIERNVFLDGDTAILLVGARSNTIGQNLIRRAAASGIEMRDGSDGNALSDNTIDGTGAPETHGGGIFLHGVSNNRIAHNLIRHTAGFGIGVSNWDEATRNVANVIEYNRLQATVMASEDSGAIYILGRSGADTQTVIAGNVIDGVGNAGRHNVGIYLDDSTGGAVVTRNLVRGVGADAVQIHGGSDNIIDNNILDISASGTAAVLFQKAPDDTFPTGDQSGNRVERNVIVTGGQHPTLFAWIDGGAPHIADNLYADAAGEIVLPAASVEDVAPRFAQAAAALAAMAGDYSQVQSAGVAAIGFTPIDLSLSGPRVALPTAQ